MVAIRWYAFVHRKICISSLVWRIFGLFTWNIAAGNCGHIWYGKQLMYVQCQQQYKQSKYNDNNNNECQPPCPLRSILWWIINYASLILILHDEFSKKNQCIKHLRRWMIEHPLGIKWLMRFLIYECDRFALIFGYDITLGTCTV